MLDRIAGFKQYLSITERERLDRMTPPEDTPELFEKYLPYAIALGVENRWAERFAGVLAAAAVQGQQGFAWYSGSNSPWDNPGGFADSVGDSLSSTISSASQRAGIEQRFGRWRVVRRRRRRRWRRRLVSSAPRQGGAEPASDRRGNRSRGARSKPSFSGEFHRRSVLRRDDRPDRCWREIGLGPVEHRAAAFGGEALPVCLGGEDPAHFGLVAKLRVEPAPRGEHAETGDQLAILTCARPPRCRSR